MLIIGMMVGGWNVCLIYLLIFFTVLGWGISGSPQLTPLLKSMFFVVVAIGFKCKHSFN